MPEIATDPIEAAAEETTVEETAVETAAEEATGEEAANEVITPDAEQRIEKIVQGIKDGLKEKPAEDKNAPSQEQIRKAWVAQVAKQTGMTEAQIEYMENRLAVVIAPYEAKEAFSTWKDSKGDLVTPDIEKSMKEYLKQYNPVQLRDKTLLDNVLAMELGKQMMKGKTVQNKPVGGAATTTTETTRINPRRTIVPTTPAPATSLTGAPLGKNGAASLTKEELEVARKMRISPEEYAQSKQTIVISELKKK